ncbi:SDR family NAD(P)-dependent oxidoreductase [Kaistia geumhonensis]|uniref:NAD(P)-dependent dehydrogenase (Short-subunit alcohol dehydrogenase family) n=1 Tax=Kaistia geumhonensis TaxID=410839 RepID=A0ABU0MBI9_9HYPH|nr:SDR family NAD(P)-dependent oxidoreductase [Kaistia geumhonensis]MCX5481270.1 SDR family NAD(P)-dependent oxidoreductase [Kaistia geumhonensis]MDQ0518331.1 NAD(P)-dependent dehydrogenase (short-subunit alcohol dehydrogenase family) [Kaistia geumhonensis]
MTHPAIEAGHVAVITGGASGIGFAAARKFLSLGLKVAIADWNEEAIALARQALGPDVLIVRTDVSSRADVEALQQAVFERFGAVHVLMNNAGIGNGGPALGDLDSWQRVIGTNLWGVVNGVQVFVPKMVASGAPGLVINTGSKQGITTPPGDTAYNVSKAGVKVLTEALQHELRGIEGGRIEAKLLIPGFVWTGLTTGDRAEKPAGAWTPGQTIDFMLASIERGDFYILCPDNEVERPTDEKRILWAAGDIVENRPPLSRWHKDYGDAFKDFLQG